MSQEQRPPPPDEKSIDREPDGGYPGDNGDSSASDNEIPSNETRPPPPETKDTNREPDGGYPGDNDDSSDDDSSDSDGKSGSGRKSGSGGKSGSGEIKPDPVEPCYSDDVWEPIHYAARWADQNPSELSRAIRTQHINARATETKYTALHIAVKFGQVEGVRQLIAAGAHINKKDVLGQTPLSLACCYDVGTDIPKQLLDADAKKNRKDKYSWRPIFWAAFRGYYNVVKLLIDYGAKKNKKDKHGKRPRDVTTNQQIRALLH